MTEIDCIIIGGGPAGLTAATYLARFRRHALVLDCCESRAKLIPETHNCPGFISINGRELLGKLTAQAVEYGAQIETGKVVSLARKGDDFAVSTPETTYSAATVIVATGIVDIAPKMDGFAADGSAGPIRFCPICDGFEAMDKRIGVLGNWEAALRKALFMRTYSKGVVIFPVDDAGARGNHDQHGLRVSRAPRAVRSDGNRVIVEDVAGDIHEVDVLYPALGCTVNSELATALGAESDNEGLIKVDERQQTTIPGLYAAGDVVSDLHQIAVATAHAAVAATSIHNSLPRNLR